MAGMIPAARKEERLIAGRRWSDLAHNKTPISRLLEEYEVDLRSRNKSEYTIGGYSLKLRAFEAWVKQEEGAGTVEDVSPAVVRRYILFMRKRGLQSSSVQAHVRALKIFGRWLFREGYTVENPLERVRLPNVEKHLVVPLTAAEKETMLKQLDQSTDLGCRDTAIVRIMLDSGLRLSEVVNLELKNADLRSQSLKVMGKGSKERKVGIGLATAKDLRRYIYNFRPEPEDDAGNLFLTRQGRPLKPGTLKLFFARLAERTGIERLHAHLLRHTFACDFLRMPGSDLFTLQDILGHTTLDMVRHYSRLSQDEVVEKHKRLSPVDFYEKARARR
jgi:site-specific recombinase XerD